MAKRQKVKIPKRIAGIKIKKRHRKQLRALVDRIEKFEELIATGSALVAMLGIAGPKLVDDDQKDCNRAGKDFRNDERTPPLAH